MIPALYFEGVSKHYRGGRGYRSIRDDVVGGVNRALRRRRAPRGVVAALDDVCFEVPQGQSFAIVGANGAGKTTALKVATRITYPTKGYLRVRGRVGALIEVGTGMHPELTGRENIRLYGRILGLSGRDVATRFDAITDFAGIGHAIDQPVKQFSSGMQLRLGFSIAAHLEPDILVVDEAIAVGDVGFQYQCVQRMAQLVREGRTLVFVSHDMNAVETLCQRAVLLDKGRILADGPAKDVVRQYLTSMQASRVAASALDGAVAGEQIEIVRISLHDRTGTEIDNVPSDEPLTIRFHYRTEAPLRRPAFTVGITDGRPGCFTLASMLMDGQMPEAIDGVGYVDCTFTYLPLLPKVYEIWGSVRGESGLGDLIDWQQLRLFRVVGEVHSLSSGAVTHSLTDAPVKLPYEWTIG